MSCRSAPQKNSLDKPNRRTKPLNEITRLEITEHQQMGAKRGKTFFLANLSEHFVGRDLQKETKSHF